MAQVGVNLVGEVDWGGAGGHFYDVAFGGIYEHLVMEQVFPHPLQELVGVRRLSLPLQQLA